MTTTTDKTPFEFAVADIDNALMMIFTSMPERMKRRYKLTGAELQGAIAFAMISSAATILTARTNAAMVDGLKLRSELQSMAAKWLLEHTEGMSEQPG